MFGNLKFIYDESPLWNEKKVKDKKEQKISAYVRFDQLYGDDQVKQEQQLEQMLQEIEQEESRQGITQVSKKLTANRKPGHFYDYNKQWAQKVNEKKQQQRIEQFNQNMNQQLESQQKSQQKTFFQETLLNNYSGPISGWQNRFENYLNTKVKLQEASEQENTFKPRINQTSQRMMQYRDRTPIEERLLKYGEELKMKQEIIRQQVIFNKQLQQKKNDILNQENDEYGNKKPQINKNYIYGESDGSRVHDKLYEYAKVYEQKMQDLKNEVQSQYNFKPEINPIPQSLLDKVEQKRKPLYHPKVREQAEVNIKTIIEQEKKPEKQFNVQNFEQFLERNYSQFERRLERLQQQKNETVFEKELDECTFQPQINKKSFAHLSVEQEKTIYERDQEMLEKKRQNIEQQKLDKDQELNKNCTFKPKNKHDIPKERRQFEEQARKDKEKKKSQVIINYPKVRCKTLVTYRNPQNEEQMDHEKSTNQQNQSYEDEHQRAFTNRHQISASQSVLVSKRQRSPLKRCSPSLKTVFKSNSSAKKGNELNQSKNDSDSKNNQSFINNLLNSGVNRGNFNLEQLLNQSIANWGDQYNLSPSKMSKKKIMEEFNQIEKEIQSIVKEVDTVKQDDISNEQGILSGNFPRNQLIKNVQSNGYGEVYDTKQNNQLISIKEQD